MWQYIQIIAWSAVCAALRLLTQTVRTQSTSSSAPASSTWSASGGAAGADDALWCAIGSAMPSRVPLPPLDCMRIGQERVCAEACVEVTYELHALDTVGGSVACRDGGQGVSWAEGGESMIECPCCGDVAAEPDADGFYVDGQELVCGCIGHVGVCREDGATIIIDDCDCMEVYVVKAIADALEASCGPVNVDGDGREVV